MTTNFKPGDVTASLRVTQDDVEGPTIHINVIHNIPGIDRRDLQGWGFDNSPRGQELSRRLLAAINAGKVFTTYEIKKDIYKQTYLETEQSAFFHGRYMRSALTTIGF
jgi:hypothetical protein